MKECVTEIVAVEAHDNPNWNRVEKRSSFIGRRVMDKERAFFSPNAHSHSTQPTNQPTTIIDGWSVDSGCATILLFIIFIFLFIYFHFLFLSPLAVTVTCCLVLFVWLCLLFIYMIGTNERWKQEEQSIDKP